MANGNLWFMSNRQPWTHAVVTGLIRTKTRNRIFIPPGAIVWLHASKALWKGWHNLTWTDDLDVPHLPSGGVYGIAKVEKVGLTSEVMPPEDRDKFIVQTDPIFPGFGPYNCAMVESIVFSKVIEIPFIACRGSQTPCRVLPVEVQHALINNSHVQEAYQALLRD